jgi:hypothetical protein
LIAQEFLSFTNKHPLFVAIYTQPGGKKTTTIKNALSDLYNITTAENDLITSKFEFNVSINMFDHSCFFIEIQVCSKKAQTWIWFQFKRKLMI